MWIFLGDQSKKITVMGGSLGDRLADICRHFNFSLSVSAGYTLISVLRFDFLELFCSRMGLVIGVKRETA
jgi:hypothetical protein